MKNRLFKFVFSFIAIVFVFGFAPQIHARVVNNLTIFNGANGQTPVGALILFNDRFYGVTRDGGEYGYGTIFEYDPSDVGNEHTVLHSFNDVNGGQPQGSLIVSGGKFYGMTHRGGANGYGTIFEYDPADVGNEYTIIHSFNFSNGGSPQGSLIVSGGKFYGMTSEGGANSYGTIFEYDPADIGSEYTVLHTFDYNNGAYPYGSLVTYNSKFYGMTYRGGINDYGTIFEYDPADVGSEHRILVSFDSNNGLYPNGSLIVSNNKLYGVATGGGSNGLGVLFEYDPAAVGSEYNILLSFGGSTSHSPSGSLVINSNKFYGITAGNNGNGTFFEYDPTPSITAPSKVTNLNTTLVSSSAINLSWSDTLTFDPDISGYKIERKVGDDDWSTLVSNTGNINTQYSDVGLISETIYSYRVSAINFIGTGLASDPVSATTLQLPPVYIETILSVNQFQGGGVAQEWQDDDSYWDYELPFTFTFYGEEYTTVYVSSNGALTFTDDSPDSYGDESIADWSSGDPVIAAFNRDLKTDENPDDDIYITDNGDGKVIFRWKAVEYDNNANRLNFEIVLNSDNTFQINYGDQSEDLEDNEVAIGVHDGDENYTASSYEGLLNFNQLNTSAWRVANSGKTISAFSVGLNSGVIDNNARTVNIALSCGSNLTSITPTIVLFNGATVSPASGVAQNFTSPVLYTVTAENGSSQTYTVTATVSACSNIGSGGSVPVWILQVMSDSVRVKENNVNIASNSNTNTVNNNSINPTDTTNKVVTSRFVFNKNLSFRSNDNDVKELQKFLNNKGFTISNTGLGSKGSETTYFGPATRSALSRFQKANKIFPAIGYFGPLTRSLVNNIN